MSLAATDLFVRKAGVTVATIRSLFSVGFSRGSSPQRTCERVALPPFRSQVAWVGPCAGGSSWGDEQRVTFEI